MVIDKYLIAKKIKIARKNAGYTQEKLAEKIGITSKQLSRIEMANYMPSMITFLNIVKILKISLAEFGILDDLPPDTLRAGVLKRIYNCTDKELQLCLNIIDMTINNLDLIKK